MCASRLRITLAAALALACALPAAAAQATAQSGVITLPEGAQQTVLGGEANAMIGLGLAGAGDLTGDGVGDLLLAGGQSNSTVVLRGGGPAGVYPLGATVDPAAAGFGISLPPDPASPIVVDGIPATGVGDVNGDGRPDVAVSTKPAGTFGAAAKNQPVFPARAGVTVLYGPVGSTVLTQGGVGPEAGFQLTHFLAQEIDAAGDFNGDGIGDLLVGGNLATGKEATAFVVYGRAGRTTVDMASFGPADGVRITSKGSAFGYTGSPAGDVNGDGFADVLVGNPYALATTGRVYVLLGGPVLPPTIDITGDVLPKVRGYAVIPPPIQGLTFGLGLADAGDVNGDGLADFVVGGPGADGGDGRAWIVLGQAGFRENLAVGPQSTPQYLVVNGPAGGRLRLGTSADGAGDVNGDGRADVLLGAPGYVDKQAGIAAVVYGRAAPALLTVAPRGLAPAGSGIAISGPPAMGRLGSAVAGLGNGRIAVSAPAGGGARSGEAYVLDVRSTAPAPARKPLLAVRGTLRIKTFSSGTGRGTRLALQTTGRASVEVTIYRLPGGRACTVPTLITFGTRSCAPGVQRLGRLKFAAGSGTRVVPFTGRIGARRLPAGSYLAVLRAAAGTQRSRLVPVTFQIAG